MERRLLLTGGALLGLLALILVLGSADTVNAGTFNPQVRFCFDDPETVDANPTEPGDPGECDGDNSAGAPSTAALGFDLPTGDVNFAGIVNYIPNEWTITPGDEFPIGTRVGTLEAIATIGLINNQCDNVLTLVGTAGFQLFNASIDIDDTIEFEEESGGEDEFREDWAEDLDGNTLIEAVDHYPAFVNRVIQDEDGNPQQPFRRSAGAIIVAGVDVLIQNLVYEPGTFIDKNLPNDADLGYPVVVTLQNAGDPELVPEPSAITDFCTPLGATTTSFGIGDACDSVVNDDPEDDDLINDGCPAIGQPESELVLEDGSDPCANNEDDDRNDDLDASRPVGPEKPRVNDGCPQAGDTSEDDIDYILARNPSEEGTYTITSIAIGQPDADGDGLENNLDVCPFDVNVGDPRFKGDGDDDEDGLDVVCDPNDDYLAGGLNSDEDADGYLNRQDNCPLVANGEDDEDNQEDNDVDADGEDDPDGIGDACDPEPLVFNGEPLAERMVTLETEVVIGPPAPGQETPTDGETPTVSEGDGGGLGTGAIIGIVIAVIAGVAVLGGGAFYFMRRGGE